MADTSEKDKKKDFILKTHELNDIKKTVAVLSGKGGVGKSLVTSLLATIVTGSHEMFIGKIEYVHAASKFVDKEGNIDFSSINLI